MSVIWAATITGIAVILAQGINGWIQLRATNRVHEIAKDTNHLVNSSAEISQARNDQLVRGLVNAGITVPLSATEEESGRTDEHS